MKTDIKLLILAILILILTLSADAKNTPLELNIVVNPYMKYDKKVKLTPADLIKPVSLSADDNIDYRKLFSLLLRLNL
jgi:hypothetical protein